MATLFDGITGLIGLLPKIRVIYYFLPYNEPRMQAAADWKPV
jgi:hypothetical protein